MKAIKTIETEDGQEVEVEVHYDTDKHEDGSTFVTLRGFRLLSSGMPLTDADLEGHTAQWEEEIRKEESCGDCLTWEEKDWEKDWSRD